MRKIENVIYNYLDFNIGDLKWVNPNPGFNSKDYVQFYNQNGKIVMDGIIGKELLISEDLFENLKTIFNLNISEIENIIRKWCRKNWNLDFPDIVVDDSYQDLGYINDI